MSKANKVYPEINRCNKFANELNDISITLNRITSNIESLFKGMTKEAILESLNILKNNCTQANESVACMKKSLNNLINSIEDYERREKARKEKGNGK